MINEGEKAIKLLTKLVEELATAFSNNSTNLKYDYDSVFEYVNWKLDLKKFDKYIDFLLGKGYLSDDDYVDQITQRVFQNLKQRY